MAQHARCVGDIHHHIVFYPDMVGWDALHLLVATLVAGDVLLVVVVSFVRHDVQRTRLIATTFIVIRGTWEPDGARGLGVCIEVGAISSALATSTFEIGDCDDGESQSPWGVFLCGASALFCGGSVVDTCCVLCVPGVVNDRLKTLAVGDCCGTSPWWLSSAASQAMARRVRSDMSRWVVVCRFVCAFTSKESPSSRGRVGRVVGEKASSPLCDTDASRTWGSWCGLGEIPTGVSRVSWSLRQGDQVPA
tara:strand:+ start:11456 stop:12202 length:747 start_codon:yes stop_codon:yes gene_type:complete